MIKRLLLTWTAILLVSSGSAKSDDTKKGEPKIDGKWVATKAEMSGKKLPKQVTANLKLTLKNGEYEVVAESPDRGTVTYDTAALPNTMDIKGVEGPNKGKTYLAIYELKDDELTICYDLSGDSRPTEFKTQPNTKLFLVTYARQKPAKDQEK
jgi:uncharacterized protein (TIGR03067 family)